MNKKYIYLIIVILIIASFIAYGRILSNDFINYDDNEYITENNHIKSGINVESIKWAFTTSVAANWHPLTWFSHILDWQLFGANASGHHFVSLLLHIGSAILLFLFLNKTTGAFWPAAFAAALFALHPLRVESVAWAAERKDVLSMFLGMATIYAYALYVEDHKLSKYFLCLALFALSLMSKPMLVTLPFLLLLLDYWPLGRWQKAGETRLLSVSEESGLVKKKGKKRKDDSTKEKNISGSPANRAKIIQSLLWEKVPFIFLTIVSSIVTIWAQSKGGAVVSLENIPFAERIFNAIVAYVAYLGKTFWPMDLAVLYPYEHSFQMGQIFGAILLLLGISVATAYFIKKTPFLFVGWFLYLGTLIPVIGLVQVGEQSMADRYTYLPSIGIAIILTWGILYLLPKEKLRKLISIPAAIIILITLTFLTWQQCGYWKNSISLFSHALHATRDNYLAHNNLGTSLAREKKYGEAIDNFLAATRIKPNYDKAYDNLGSALASQGRNEEAITNFLIAIKISPNNYTAYYNLAHSYRKLGNIKEAMKYFKKTLEINPREAGAYSDIGIILDADLSKKEEAIYHFRKAVEIEPNNALFYFNLALCLMKKGDLEESIQHFRKAIYLKPDYEEALRALKLAVEIDKQKN